MRDDRLVATVRAAAELYDSRLSDAVRFERIEGALDRILDDAGPEAAVVSELDTMWSGLTAAAFRDADQYDALRAELPANDPATAPWGLLELVGAARREPLHTLALASLIDPSRCPIGGRLLQSLLGTVLPEVGRELPPIEVLAMAKVSAEKSYEVRLGRKGEIRRPRPDLRIELAGLVVVIENKIDDIDRENQLSGYAQAARAFHDDEPVFVYLTPDGDQPTAADAEDWQILSYRTLALTWRRLLAADEAAGRQWPDAARAYLATLARTVCDWRPEDASSRATRSRLVPYLQAATGR